MSSKASSSKLPSSTTTPTTTSNPRPITTKKPSSSTPKPNLNQKKRKLPIPLPPRPTTSSHPTANPSKAKRNPRKPATLPTKPLQGLHNPRTDSSRDGYGREVVFVTRRVGLGTLIGRCRALVINEGYTSLTLHALSAAIPQALLLLHALLDILPYPTGLKGMWYEIKTGSVECVDEISSEGVIDLNGEEKGKSKGGGKGEAHVVNDVVEGKEGQALADEVDVDLVDDGDDEEAELEKSLGGIGGIEEPEPTRSTRIKSSIQIILHISPRPLPKAKPIQFLPPPPNPNLKSNSNPDTSHTAPKTEKKNRPSKKRRLALARSLASTNPDNLVEVGEGGEAEEEAMMNGMEVDHDEEEEEEAIEEVEV